MTTTTLDITSRALSLAADIGSHLDALRESGLPEDAWGDDETLAALMDTVEGLGGEIGSKLDAIRFVRSRLDADEEFLRAEAARLTSKARSRANASARLGEAGRLLLDAHAAMTGEAKVKTPLGSHWIQGTLSVQGPADVAAWPSEWVRTKVEADRRQALIDLKADPSSAPEGFSLVETFGWRAR